MVATRSVRWPELVGLADRLQQVAELLPGADVETTRVALADVGLSGAVLLADDSTESSPAGAEALCAALVGFGERDQPEAASLVRAEALAVTVATGAGSAVAAEELPTAFVVVPPAAVASAAGGQFLLGTGEGFGSPEGDGCLVVELTGDPVAFHLRGDEVSLEPGRIPGRLTGRVDTTNRHLKSLWEPALAPVRASLSRSLLWITGAAYRLGRTAALTAQLRPALGVLPGGEAKARLADSVTRLDAAGLVLGQAARSWSAQDGAPTVCASAAILAGEAARELLTSFLVGVPADSRAAAPELLDPFVDNASWVDPGGAGDELRTALVDALLAPAAAAGEGE